MYYVAKIIQAGGLTLILIGFLLKFPKLMNPRLFIVGLIIFLAGWISEKFLLKK